MSYFTKNMYKILSFDMLQMRQKWFSLYTEEHFLGSGWKTESLPGMLHIMADFHSLPIRRLFVNYRVSVSDEFDVLFAYM